MKPPPRQKQDAALQRGQAEIESVLYATTIVLPQTIEVVPPRAKSAGIEVKVAYLPPIAATAKRRSACAAYPAANGDGKPTRLAEAGHADGGHIVVVSDCAAAAHAEGEWGAYCVLSAIRSALAGPAVSVVPHAAYRAVRDDFKAQKCGPLVGVTIDCPRQDALRLAIQTREQHIRREKGDPK